jgi:type IV secretory pathway protease TraF
LAAGSAAVLVLAYQTLSPFGLALNTTHSIPQGLYFSKTGAPSPLLRGQTVCFAYAPPSWAKGRAYFEPGRRLCKHVAGLPGDRTVRKGLALSLFDARGQLVLEARLAATDRKGEAIPPGALSSGTIPEGKVLLLAPANENSLDSRYLGLIDRAALSHQIWPLWVQS